MKHVCFVRDISREFFIRYTTTILWVRFDCCVAEVSITFVTLVLKIKHFSSNFIISSYPFHLQNVIFTQCKCLILYYQPPDVIASHVNYAPFFSYWVQSSCTSDLTENRTTLDYVMSF